MNSLSFKSLQLEVCSIQLYQTVCFFFDDAEFSTRRDSTHFYVGGVQERKKNSGIFFYSIFFYLLSRNCL